MLKLTIDIKLSRGALFMADTIKYNLIEMRSSAKVIKQSTKQIESILKSADGTINAVCCDWSGAAYFSFMDEYRRVRPFMNSLVKKINWK